MSSIANKSIAEIFKDLFYLDNSNAGFTTSTKQIKDGGGGASVLNVSSKELTLSPLTDSTSTFKVKDQDGNTLFVINSTDDVVKAGLNSQIVNTQYVEYMAKDVDLTGLKHWAIPRTATPNAFINFGTGLNPTVLGGITTTADDLINSFWYTDSICYLDNILIWLAGNNANDDTLRFHLVSFDIDTSNSSTGGDLSDIIIHASSSDISSVGYEQAYYTQITPSIPTIGAGRAVFLTLKADSDNADYSVNSRIKYHL
jgi:hypothetical protein